MEESCEEQSYDGQNEEGPTDEEDSDEEDEEEDESDSGKPKKHEESKGGKGERRKVECDQGKGGKGENEYVDEEESGKVECDKAECDLIEQTASLNSENNSPEKTSVFSQDSDTHFFSPVESSASRSRSSSDSRYSNVSNDIPRRSSSPSVRSKYSE